ncbi:transglutaminase-like cysteine peptidase [Rhizobium sp. L1K21]|uniref:transglutaminase-like cysteine peptidase n=1 Tax=Rhizobium sp. L1K21 TaxID=2954933 RepID=UPI0020932539|nr:transglutaminase-like cysteine peptidase [Rhizobium sp. L1K21]MCO6187237.1 transglutaminase-like cysteine peptidase [Rhizobium sp. L1K21]
MYKKLGLAFVAAVGMSLLTVADASAISLGSASRQHNSTARSNAPLQFQLFCLQNPADCRSSGPAKISYTSKVRKLLTQVNSQVNRQIKPRREKTDVWQISTREGDCDDYVMTKRHKLMAAGIPSSALRIAVVKTKKGAGHAVLVVKTSAGELVLDNLRKNIVSRQASGYRYVTVSSANPMRWN